MNVYHYFIFLCFWSKSRMLTNAAFIWLFDLQKIYIYIVKYYYSCFLKWNIIKVFSFLINLKKWFIL